MCFKIDTLEDKIKEMSQRDDAEIGKYEKQIRDNEVKASGVRSVFEEVV
jgi:hypothetical protein